ncbi:MAG: hypothetical protein AB4372_32955 [Xenococcus sp. (in: cyanobacteria)]
MRDKRLTATRGLTAAPSAPPVPSSPHAPPAPETDSFSFISVFRKTTTLQWVLSEYG